jgi:hypothetical protein
MGRKTKITAVTKEQLEKVTSLISNGVIVENIGKMVFGVCRFTFNDLRKRFPELEEAVQDGMNAQEQALAGKVFKIAMEDGSKSQVACLFFLLKCVHRWREKEPAITLNVVPETTTMLTAISDKVVGKKEPKTDEDE